MKLKSKEYQDLRDQWLAERLKGIGASDASAILGVNPWKSALEVWTEKRGLTAPKHQDEERLAWGHRLEQPIADAYEEETGRITVDPGDFYITRHESLTFVCATLDRQVTGYAHAPTDTPLIKPPAPGIGVLEIKTTGAHHADDWQDEPPLYYQIQLQHQLAVTGYHWGSLAVLIGGQELRWQDIPRNESFIAKLLAQEEAFWRSVIDGNPPAPDASESAKDALHVLYPKERQDTLALVDPTFVALDEERAQAVAQIKHYDTIKNSCENTIKAALGDHAYGILPNGVRYSWRLQTRAGYTVAPSETRVLRRSAPKGGK